MRRFIWLILIGVAYLLWRMVGRKADDPDMGWRHFSRFHRKSRRFQTGVPMVKDPVCGVYIPKAEAVERDGEWFCSEECADKWHRKQATS